MAAHTHFRPPDSGDGAIYISAARSLAAGHGYHSALEATGVPPYPPGLPLVLVPAALLSGGGLPMQATLWLFGLLLVLAVWACAVEIGGHRAGVAAGVLLMLSPGVLHAGSEVMADAPATLAVVCALWAIHREWRRAAGVMTALAAVFRLNALIYLGGLVRQRRALGAALAVLCALAVFQFAVHGNLMGYTGGQAQFGLRYLTGHTVLETWTQPSAIPNWDYYYLVIFGRLGLVAPGLPFIAGLALWTRRRTLHARFATWVLVSTVVEYLFYYFQSVRFMLPVWSVLIIYASVGLVDAVEAGNRILTRRDRDANGGFRTDNGPVSARHAVGGTPRSRPTYVPFVLRVAGGVSNGAMRAPVARGPTLEVTMSRVVGTPRKIDPRRQPDGTVGSLSDDLWFGSGTMSEAARKNG